MTRNRFVVIGKAVKPFGIRGEIKITPFTESFEAFEHSEYADSSGNLAYKVIRIRIHKRAALVSLEGIDTPETASKLVGTLSRPDEENLPPKRKTNITGSNCWECEVSTVDGRDLGKITSYHADRSK